MNSDDPFEVKKYFGGFHQQIDTDGNLYGGYDVDLVFDMAGIQYNDITHVYKGFIPVRLKSPHKTKT